MTGYQLRKRGGLDGEGDSLPFLRTEPDMALPEALHVTSAMSGILCTSIDVMDGDRYLVTYCGGGPCWWLPGTHGGGMHQISSGGWCHDCFREGAGHVHHLTRDIEVAVLTSEALDDPVLRQRLKKRGRTAEQYAEETAGNALPLEWGGGDPR